MATGDGAGTDYDYGMKNWSESDEGSDNGYNEDIPSMSIRLATSGSYNVHASEMSHDRPLPKTVPCIVHFLDESSEAFEIDKRSKSQVLLDRVFNHLELTENDYFGLQFHDSADQTQESIRWLDPMKTLKKQMRAGPPYELFFRVKFYVCDPCKLSEEYTRYHFFLQLKRDILEDRLICPHPTAALLASFAVQSDLGDFNPDEHPKGYLSDFCLIPNQSQDFEFMVAQYHQQHRGQTPSDAEFNFLEKAKNLDMYGVDLHRARVRDQTNMEIQLGVTSYGLVVFQNNVKINTFSWSKIVKISFKRKQFFIQLRRESSGNESVENLIGFNMVSYRCCKNLWKSCVEHHTFFRLHAPNPPSKKIFGMGSRFRYSGRTEFQTIEDSKRRAKIERSFSRSPSKRFARRTVGGTTRAAIYEERNSIDGYRNMPKSSSFSNSKSNGHIASSQDHFTRYNSLSRSGNSLRATLPSDYERKRISWSSHRNTVIQPDSDDGFLSQPLTHNDHPATCNGPEPSYDLPMYDDQYLPNTNGYGDSQGLVTIKMQPDDQGRFGFNVKGGADQGMPIIVSRVAPNTPADMCIPRLNEGDQVLYINGRDVSQHTHEQVVMFIRASREPHSGGELTLVVRPNVYVGDDPPEEPDLMYIPETHQITSSSCADALDASLMLLQEALENGAAMAQFDQLYRKKPGLTTNCARVSENIPKNRYRDISPYDQTRVVLDNSNGGDYINANFVNMEIPGSGVVNRYIAAQGPLPNTCVDFWQMVWEQHSSVVVMLTAKVERGRPKCHQYWPDLYETTDFGTLQITCVKEEESDSFAFREFTLSHVETSEERQIVHMQYIAWPDHGVPDDSSDFLDFVLKVRQNRVGMVEPTIVHCSAGIGRTGVLITMETAMCLIEANQAVYPQSIVRQMRDQRAMLIQTASQYKFVCEAITRVYNDELVKPLNDYQR